jgi:hypothetical protein
VFVHVGLMHLLFNVIGAYFLGRIAEELYGGARTVALFGASGIAGAYASYLAAPSGLSSGASGAVLGLLGAVFVELTLNRDRYRTAWKRGLWGGVLVVTISQLVIGFLYPVIDQWAHGAGLFTGAVFGAALSPHARWAAVGRHAGRVLAIAFAAVVLAGAALVARTSIADSYGAIPLERRVVNGVAFEAPSTWVAAGKLFDPDGFVEVQARVQPVELMQAQMDAWLKVNATELEKQYQGVGPARAPAIPLPEGWHGGELTGSFEDPMGAKQQIVVVVASRAFGGQLVHVSLALPASVARAAPALFAAVLASARPL